MAHGMISAFENSLVVIHLISFLNQIHIKELVISSIWFFSVCCFILSGPWKLFFLSSISFMCNSDKLFYNFSCFIPKFSWNINQQVCSGIKELFICFHLFFMNYIYSVFCIFFPHSSNYSRCNTHHIHRTFLYCFKHIVKRVLFILFTENVAFTRKIFEFPGYHYWRKFILLQWCICISCRQWSSWIPSVSMLEFGLNVACTTRFYMLSYSLLVHMHTNTEQYPCAHDIHTHSYLNHNLKYSPITTHSLILQGVPFKFKFSFMHGVEFAEGPTFCKIERLRIEMQIHWE